MAVANTLTPEQQLARIATPTRVGKWLIEGPPQIWGGGETYDIDPWLALTEQSALDAVLDEKQRFLRVHVPPQVGKTTFSTLLIFWTLGMFPDKRIIFITYSDDIAAIRGKEIRQLIKAYGKELFGIEIDPDFDLNSDFRIKGHRGGLLCAGIGSQITGRSGDIIVLDDIIKNAVEAASVATKSSHIREYDSTIRPRLQPGGTILMTATRWAEDDLGGTLESRAREPGYRGDKWEVLSFPAIAEPDPDVSLADIDEDTWTDILGRKLGQPLQCRFTDLDLAWEDTTFYILRDSTDDLLAFSCLFQQNPTSRSGGMFPPDKWRRYRYAELPEMAETWRFWDPAATEGGGDWSTGTKVGRGVDRNFYILDVHRFRMSADKVLEQAKITGRADGYDVHIGVEEERAGAGKSVVTFWQKEMPEHQVKGIRPQDTKETRATPYSSLQQAGRVFIPHDDEKVEWVKEFIDQHRKMMGDGRRGKHDDMVDTAAYAILQLLDFGPVQLVDMSASVNPDAESQMEALLLKHSLGLV